VLEQPITRPSLLLRVRNPRDEEAWREFVELYGSLIYRFASKRGLQDADAADLTQNVFHVLAGEMRRLDYDPRRGSFRGWLYAVVRNHVNNFFHRQKRGLRGSGDTGIQDLLEKQEQPEAQNEALWEEEYERRLFRWAAERVRGHFQEASWQAFWQTAVEGKNAGDVAKELGITVGAVYTAKSRVLDAIRREVQQLQGEIGQGDG
jgi:RNA polymerase sigma-70 factor (ECF subfamily)